MRTHAVLAMPETSLRGFARTLSVSDYAVRKAVASGRLPASCVGRDGRGRPVITDVDAAKAAWTANAAKLPKQTQTGRLAAAQEALTLERVKRERRENELAAGRLVSLNDAEKQRFESMRMVREQLLNVAPRLAPELAAETDPQKVFARLDVEIRAALHAVADALEQA